MKTALLTFLLSACATAQLPADPPALVRVIRSPLQPYSKLYADAHAAVTVLGMTSLSGPSESWLIEAYDSFAAIEDLDKALRNEGRSIDSAPSALASDDVLAPSRTFIALYRPGWSYRAEEAVKLLPKARYFQVSIYRSPSVDDEAFSTLIKSRSLGLESVNLDRPDIAYEVISGAPSGTYLLLTPLVSLRTLDDSLAARAGSSEAAKTTISREHLLFRIEPGLSYVSPDFASGDPDFWSGKVRPGGRR